MFFNDFLEFLWVNKVLDCIYPLEILVCFGWEYFKEEWDDGDSDFFVLVLAGADVILAQEGSEVDLVHGVLFVQGKVEFVPVLCKPAFSFGRAKLCVGELVYGVHPKSMGMCKLVKYNNKNCYIDQFIFKQMNSL